MDRRAAFSGYGCYKCSWWRIRGRVVRLLLLLLRLVCCRLRLLLWLLLLLLLLLLLRLLLGMSWEACR